MTRKDFLESASTTTAPVSSTSKLPPVSPTKRPRKTEIKYRGRIYLVSGEKGGVGKTIIARCLIEVLRQLGFKVEPIEADAKNADIERIFRLDFHVNLQMNSGYMDLLNHIERIEGDSDIVISLPAGALAGAEQRGAFFTEAIETLSKDLVREVIVVWPIDDKITSVQMLKDFIEECPEVRVDVFKNKFFFDDFQVYDNSNTRQTIETSGGKTLEFPRLEPEVMQMLVNDNLTFEKALSSFTLGYKWPFQVWLKRVNATFKSANYLTREGENDGEA